MSKSLDRRIDKLEQSSPADDRERITDISFIIPGETFHQFGIEFESVNQCLAYCVANDIPYAKEKGVFGFDTYAFPNE